MNIPKVLLVDDETNILRSLRRVLRKSNVEVVTTTSPAEALQLVESDTFAVVLSDQRMPEMEGTKLLGQVRLLSPDSVRIILTGYADIQATMDAINTGAVYRYLNKPWDDGELRLTIRQAVDRFLLTHENKRLRTLTDRQNAELRDLNNNLKQKVMERSWEVMRLNEQLERSFINAVQAMARIGEMYSVTIGSHSKRVAALSKQIGTYLELAEKDLLQVEVGALLHDIGKIQIDTVIVQKPRHEMDHSERAVLREHPIHGEAIVQMVPHLDDAALYVRHHHERFDGRGYPDRLHGSSIPLGARIVAVANAYDEVLNSPSSFSSATPGQALLSVRDATPAAFDPIVVEALTSIVGKTENEEQQNGDIEIGMKDLRPGMVLSRDLMSRHGKLLVRKNSMIMQTQLEQLHLLHASDPILTGISVYRRWPLTTQNGSPTRADSTV